MVVLAAMDQPSSVPTSDISAHPTMFEIDMRSSVPDQDYITNVSVTHDSAEQAGKFTASTAGLTTKLDNLLGDSPNAITVICKFKNNAANTTNVLFHIGLTAGVNVAFGIDIQSTVVYLYTWNDDNKYKTIDLNLGTQWNEMIAIFDESKPDPDRLILYVNGVKQTALNGITLNGETYNYASSPTIDLSENKKLYVGHRNNSTYWSGYMKHIKIFPKVVYGLIKIKVKLTLNHAEDSFSYNAENYPSILSDMTTFLQDVYFKYQLKDGVTPSNSIGMFVDFKINGNSTNPNDNVQYNAYRYFSTSGEGQGTIYNNQNSIENNDFKIRIGGSSDNYDKNNTYAILTFHRELIEKDILSKSSGKIFKLPATDGQITQNLYHKHTETININSKKTRLVFKKLYLDNDNIRFKDRIILKYKNTSGQDTWVQFGTQLIFVNSQYKNIIKYITYDNEVDAYTLTNISDTQDLGWEFIPPSYTVYTIDISATERDVEMIFLASSSHPITPSSGTPAYGFEIEIREDVFLLVDPTPITPNVQNLTNTIDLSDFVTTNKNNIYDWSDYVIKFTTTTTDGITTEQSFDIDPVVPTFRLNMLLKQLEEDVTCRFDILKKTDDSVVHTSSNFTLVKQTVTASNFDLTLQSVTDSSILFKNYSEQWIYMHESNSLNSTNILYSKYIVSPSDESKVSYTVYFVDDTGQSSQSLTNDDEQKITLRVELSKSGDTISFTDTTEFIIHKVNFSAFHTPIINPISNINYFKEKTFRFTVSNNFYSFKFPNNNSGITYTTKDIINSDTQIIDSSDKSSFPKPIVVTNPSTAVIDVNIMDYLFTNGDNNLKFTIKNTLNGATSIYNTTDIIQQEITSIPETITLNVESDAIISCIPS